MFFCPRERINDGDDDDDNVKVENLSYVSSCCFILHSCIIVTWWGGPGAIEA